MLAQTQSTSLRSAIADDCELYFVWANDESVREQSFDSRPIVWANHCVWFDRMLSDPTVKMSVLMFDDNAVGQIRLTQIDGWWNISYSIDARYRQQGFGQRIVELGVDGMGRCVAEVKAENVASNRVFASLGFEQFCLGEVVTWRQG